MLSKPLKFGPKWQFLYLKPILSAIFVTIATIKIKENAEILYFSNSSNKKIGEKQFQFLAPGGPN